MAKDTPSASPVVASPASPQMFTADQVTERIADAVKQTADAMKPRYTVTFWRVAATTGTDAKSTKAITEANADVFGAFGQRLSVAGWAIARDRKSRALIVYTPSGGSGFYKHVKPRVNMLPVEKQIVSNGVRITSQDDPIAVADLDRLKDAVLAAWATNPADGAEIALNWTPAV